MSNNAFNIVKSGAWPTESYSISVDPNFINPNLGLLPAQNHFNFLRNYINDITSISRFNYYNSNPVFSDYGLDQIDSSLNTTFSWNVSAERASYDIGPTFNFFDINIKPGSTNLQTPTDSSIQNYLLIKKENIYYSYIIYPNRLFLYPSQPTFDGTNWSLETNTVLLSTATFFLFSSSREDNFVYHNYYINSTPNIETIPLVGGENYSIVYSLCAYRCRVDVPVIEFTNDYNPFYYSTILEKCPVAYETCKIRPESVLITYRSNFYRPDGSGMGEIGQLRPDFTYGNQKPSFISSYILKYNPSYSNVQTFQLLQIKNDNTSKYLSDSSYCVLSAIVNLDNSNFQYYSNYKQNSDLTITNNITGVPDSTLGISYVADSPYFKYSSESCLSTVTSTTYTLNNSYSLNTSPASYYDNVWVTKYPPHYYGYKVTIKDDNSNLKETANLNFYLYSSAINTQTNYVVLSTYVVSDFNIIRYDLFTSSKNDYIKYEVLNSNPTIIGSLSCLYGKNFQYNYSLLTSDWVPVSAAKDLKIIYPNKDFGQISLTIRPTLCSIAGELDAITCTKFTLAKGSLPANLGPNIFLERINERIDYIEADSSFITSEGAWPYKDLRNSYITWDINPKGQYTTINAIDLSGNFIQQIQPGLPVLFDNTTSTISVSGYGPQPTTITLSSQKYNQTTSLISNSALFDYFKDGNLNVSIKNLKNLELIRTMQFDCFYNYKGKQYPLPNNIKINWNWSFGGSIDFNNIPVSAYYLNNQNYNFGYNDLTSSLSSIKINTIPPYSKVGPTLTNLTVNANIDSINGLVVGTYSLDLDDFPDPSIFNADFYANYLLFSSSKYTIAKTRYGQYVITRPNDGTNHFIFKPSEDVLPYLNLDTTNFFWSISSSWQPYNTIKNKTSALVFDPYVASTNVITLCTYNTIFPGWVSAHSVKSQLTFYVLDLLEFYKPLEFNVIPEYFWKNGPYLTLTNQNNFTNSIAPTAYGNKISNSQNFYLSANKSNFTNYKYTVGLNKDITLDTVQSYYDLVELPYIAGEIDSDRGMTVYLTAFNDTTYPEYNGTTFIAPVGYTLRTFPFNIVSSTYPETTAIDNPFRYNPKTVPYDSATLSYTSVYTNFDLSNQRIISITQTISTNPLNSPSIPVDGTVTYTISNTFWSVNVDIPAQNGTFELAALEIGDYSQPLVVSGSKNNNITLSVSANIGVKIPSTTFNNEPSYTGNKDLWNTVYQQITAPSTNLFASNSQASPIVFFSTTYTKTSSDVFVKFETPYLSNNLSIVGYMLDFGDDSGYEIITYDEFSFHQYNQSGTYYISYTAFFSDGSSAYYQNPNPFIVLNNWEIYNPNYIRFTYESILNIPYDNEQISIQPNEWGDADIFNTAIERLSDNLDYLIGNTQTIDTNTPTVFYGWFGSNSQNLAEGIRWYTKTYGNLYFNKPQLAIGDGSSYFSDIKDVVDTGDILFILDGTRFRAFSAGNIGNEIMFQGSSDLESNFLDPISIEITSDSKSVFVADPPKNKIYRIDLQLDATPPSVDYVLNIGSLGNKEDTNKFNSPSDLASANTSLFVLDYNNHCVKQYNNTLNWIHTYYTNDFETNKPISITAHPEFEFLYVLTNNFIVYVFDKRASDSFSSFSISETNDGSGLVKIVIDEAGEFIYILTSNNVYKYTVDGYFIAKLNLPSDITFVGAAKSFNRSLYFLTKNGIIKIQDVLKLHKIGEGLDNDYWTLDQLKINRDEFASDINYNRSLIRMAQNIKTFRNSLLSKFVLATEQTDTSIVTYFTMIPISVSERPALPDKIENETVGVGVNELHVPQVLNRELQLLNYSLYILTDFLDIKNFNIQNGKVCDQEFCWSWNAMSCYNLTLPAIKICNINPITYDELKSKTPLSYAPTKTWKDAVSNCCSGTLPPI